MLSYNLKHQIHKTSSYEAHKNKFKIRQMFSLEVAMHTAVYSPSVAAAATTKHLVSQNRNILSMLCSRFANHVSRLSSKSYFNNSYFNIMGNFRGKFSRKSSWKLFHFRQFKTSPLIVAQSKTKNDIISLQVLDVRW